MFGWVGNAFHSERLGFMALFFQWFQITVGMVTMSYFIFIAIAFLQLRGTKATAAIAKWGFMIGILGTSVILFVFTIMYLAQGNPVQIHFGVHDFFPDFTKAGSWAIFATLILAFAGIEASGSHINELQKPEQQPPAGDGHSRGNRHCSRCPGRHRRRRGRFAEGAVPTPASSRRFNCSCITSARP